MTANVFSEISYAAPDPIFALTAGYKADPSPNKINLGVGAYRDDTGKPWVLPVVKKAAALIEADGEIDHEYLPIAGLPDFVAGAAKLILGENSPAIAEGRVASTQTISGTGANHLGALFLHKFYPFPSSGKKIYVSNPTWANHNSIFSLIGFEPVPYPYYDPKTIGLDFPGFKGSLEQAEEGSVFLVHACAHNPTGVDPTAEQWEELVEVILAKKHFIFLDSAYQGFASGDLEKDATAVRMMVDRGVPLLICQSFAKNAGLYGERVGALHIVPGSKESATKIQSQVALLQRAEISSPPAWGARVMALILGSPQLFAEWKVQIKQMADRIIEMRQQLRAELERLGTPGKWNHITDQIGMFSFTGLKPEQTKILLEKYSVYLTSNGRISMAGLNKSNVSIFAKAVDEVVRGEDSKL
ncbi:aspartate aminotransferase [Phaffia rhodozyma]|uniref:Aspartate aminotransferase n=1 Tax=Phaffia rhodozyma TaxID=264483 RepID=A0A0F7SKG2_PHARH|nr:aspartate aminotransferase [Phaffia rhodozyma]